MQFLFLYELQENYNIIFNYFNIYLSRDTGRASQPDSEFICPTMLAQRKLENHYPELE